MARRHGSRIDRPHWKASLMKSRILEVIGATELARAAQVNDALAANDRIKYYFSLLQMAIDHADHPDRPAVGLKRERRACGIDDTALDDVVETAERRGSAYRLPGAARIMRRIGDDMRVMADRKSGV